MPNDDSITHNHDEPNTLDTLKWPPNVLIFHPPDEDEDDDPKNAKKDAEVQRKHQAHTRTTTIHDIQRRIRDTEDERLETFTTPSDHHAHTGHTSKKHFSSHHYALLFAPGEYPDCHFQVGYYVQVMGLGANASDVRFTSSISESSKESTTPSTLRCGPYVSALNKNKDDNIGTCLITFWRSAENFSVVGGSLQWAVSQAAPLRRIHIMVGGDLCLGDGAAYASGGFLANAYISGTIQFMAQQQFYSRHVHIDNNNFWKKEKHGNNGPGIQGGAWNLTFSGCTTRRMSSNNNGDGDGDNDVVPVDLNGPDSKNPNLVYTSEPQPRIRMEKPFLTLDGDRWYLRVPKATTMIGPQLDDKSAGEARDFCRVKVVTPRPPEDKDPLDIHAYNTLDQLDETITTSIQGALDVGKDVILCPGTFFLTRTLIMKTPNQVILGLGLATLVAPKDGSPCIRVLSNVPGVRIAGITLEASAQDTLKRNNPEIARGNVDGVGSLLEFGEPNADNDDGDQNNPGLLSDIFCRVGGVNQNRLDVQTDVMVRIHSGHVIGDNLWLWRADHTELDHKGCEVPNDPKLPLYHQTRFSDEKGIYECAVDTGLEVRGSNVYIYGLFCEHTLKDQVVWKGEHGNVSFYQCELPYDVRASDFVDHYGYFVDKSVTHHNARGVGVYSNFQVDSVRAPAGIHIPRVDGVQIDNPFTVFLDGCENPAIESVVMETLPSSNHDESDKRHQRKVGPSSTSTSKGIPSRVNLDCQTAL